MPGPIRDVWLKFTAWPYSLLVIGPILLIPVYLFLVPLHHYSDDHNTRAAVLAFLCGALVGVTEISSRYRDEQLKAVLSPDGLVYILFNGAISTFALILIFHFRYTVDALKVFQGRELAAAIAAGFGASAIMRTRLAVIKGADNKDISIGPDIVINLLLAMIDRRIDRWRSAHRIEIIAEHFDELKSLGSIDDASKYLRASLLSFQNLGEVEKKDLTDTIESNKRLGYSDNIQFAAMGFLFLTVVGEENFDSVLKKAKQFQGQTPPPSPPAAAQRGAPPTPPAIPPSPPAAAQGAAPPSPPPVP